MKYLVYILAIACAGCSQTASVADLYNRGKIEFQNKNLKAAEQTFADIVKLDGSHLNARLMLAKIHYYNKEYDNTLEDIELILEKDHDHTGALYWKGRTLVVSGKDDKTDPVPVLQNVLENDSHHIPARLLLALLYEKKGNYKESLYEYITAVSEEESLLSARGNLAVLYMRLGLRDRALQEIDRAVKISEITGRDSKALNLIKSELNKWEGK